MAMNAFWNAYTSGTARDTQLVPVDALKWDSYDQRVRRYELFTAFVTSTVYSDIYRHARTRMDAAQLYKFTRSIYNPSARLIDLYASFVYGGALDMEHLTGGALPIITDNDALIDALRQVYQWSRLAELKTLYVRDGAQHGDAPIKVIDDPERGKVRLELLDPRKLRHVEFDAVGNVKAAVIEYEREDALDAAVFVPGANGLHPLERTAQSYTYTEIIDHDPTDDALIRFRTYKNGEPFAFTQDEDGEDVAEWSEPYGFVPLVIAGHKATTKHWHRNAFDSVIPGIDTANDAASLLLDQVRKSTNPIWAFIGVSGGTLDLSVDKKDAVPFVKLPTGGDAKPLVFPLDITGALEHLRELLKEIERNAPELALQRIRESSGSLTAPGVRTAYSDAIGRIEEARGSYDGGLVRALQMAVTIGGYRGYDSFASFGLDSYAAGDLDFYVKDRPVISDELTSEQRITALQSVGNSPAPVQRLILKEMNFSDADIDDVLAEAEKQAQAQQNQLTEADANNADALMQKLMAGDGGASGQPTVPVPQPNPAQVNA